ncbi:tyrosine-type recombinase/integrase [Pilimelia columellifera]|uniref:Tyrosine-type recombinase/integrase n=1 Tax=Pilimelia columellifera subsp. columellifera TaxID=706583 RepID=A0ABN3NJM4_9ACTN
MKGSTYKRCGCRDTTGKALGKACPKLRRGRGDWSPHHGAWHYQIELPATTTGKRRPLRAGSFANQTEAEVELNRVRDALALADASDPAELAAVGDLIEASVRTGQKAPTTEQVRRMLFLGRDSASMPTTGQWLAEWLAGRKGLEPGTARSYEGHLRLYLVPHLGTVRLDKLRVGHLDAMFDAITERNDQITTFRASRDEAKRALVRGMRPVGPATMQRIRATLRVALNTAIKQRLIDFNAASHVELPSARSPKALVWTAERVKRWKNTGTVASPVMVWTPAQTGAFLDHAAAADDPLYALYHLVAHIGLRRGEACGLHWADLDLDAGQVTVRWQITQLGWATQLRTPKTASSEHSIAIDAGTIAVLRAHRLRQRKHRLAAGQAWTDTGLVFTTAIGAALHPADVTGHFQHLGRQAGLPPIRLHDLRHGAATLALAAGVDMKTVQEMLRHSSYKVTADTYASVLPEIATAAAEKTAAIIPRRVLPVAEGRIAG